MATILKAGSTGLLVSMLQELLNKANLPKQLHKDGKFGLGTQEAVRLFQRKAGLKTDGIVGPETAGALAKLGGSQANAFAQALGASQDKKAELEEKKKAEEDKNAEKDKKAELEEAKKAKLLEDGVDKLIEGGKLAKQTYDKMNASVKAKVFGDISKDKVRCVKLLDAHFTGAGAGSVEKLKNVVLEKTTGRENPEEITKRVAEHVVNSSSSFLSRLMKK